MPDLTRKGVKKLAKAVREEGELFQRTHGIGKSFGDYVADMLLAQQEEIARLTERISSLKWDMDCIAAQLGLTSREDVPKQVMEALNGARAEGVRIGRAQEYLSWKQAYGVHGLALAAPPEDAR
jgi:hypothetical protein